MEGAASTCLRLAAPAPLSVGVDPSAHWPCTTEMQPRVQKRHRAILAKLADGRHDAHGRLVAGYDVRRCHPTRRACGLALRNTVRRRLQASPRRRACLRTQHCKGTSISQPCALITSWCYLWERLLLARPHVDVRRRVSLSRPTASRVESRPRLNNVRHDDGGQYRSHSASVSHICRVAHGAAGRS
jgi:hypothetical protein